MSTSRMKQEIHCSFSWTLQCCEVCHFSFLVRTVVKWWQQHHRSGPASCIPSTEKSSSKSQKMNLWWAQSFVTKDSLAGGRPQPARLPDVGGPKWFELQKTREDGSCCVFFLLFFNFSWNLCFFFLVWQKSWSHTLQHFSFQGEGFCQLTKRIKKEISTGNPAKTDVFLLWDTASLDLQAECCRLLWRCVATWVYWSVCQCMPFLCWCQFPFRIHFLVNLQGFQDLIRDENGSYFRNPFQLANKIE